MIRNRQRGLFVQLRALDQIIDTIRAVKERILGVAMQVDERHGPRKITSWRLLRRVTGAATAVLIGVLALTPTGCYLSRAAYEEARILSRRQSIDRLLIDSGRSRSTSVTANTSPSLDAATLAKLRLVSEARTFAVSALELKAGKSFTQFSRLDRDTLVLVLSAAYRDRLERKTWWFPVVGTFPYKGFFDFEEAKRTRDQLSRDGFDVTLGPSSAFSTLGWFNDPLVSTTIKADSVTLVNTVLHELLHNTFFAKGRVAFNESFASFVGGRGAEAFFRARGDTALLRRAEEDWQDDLRLGAFWARVSHEIDSVFSALPDSARVERLAARETVYAAAKRRLVDSVGPQLRGYPPGWAEKVVLNNAVLLSRRVYAEGLDGFDSVYVAEGGDLKKAVQRIVERERR
ncbi:MAG: aminopeptidase [Gemmatimonas sp.]